MNGQNKMEEIFIGNDSIKMFKGEFKMFIKAKLKSLRPCKIKIRVDDSSRNSRLRLAGQKALLL